MAPTDKEQLLKDLERLKSVSSLVVEKTQLLASSPEDTKLRNELDALWSQQSYLLERFIARSRDERAISEYREAVKELDHCSKSISVDEAKTAEGAEALRVRVLRGIERWIGAVEQIIVGVFSSLG